jgi:hypothetical protein
MLISHPNTIVVVPKTDIIGEILVLYIHSFRCDENQHVLAFHPGMADIFGIAYEVGEMNSDKIELSREYIQYFKIFPYEQLDNN